MLTPDFYDIVDKELDEIIKNETSRNELLKKHNSIANQKSLALLIWFLEFYARLPVYQQYITEGDGDNSCDIIFEKTNFQGKRIFYVVQSKWKNKKNCETKVDSKEIKTALSDFETIIGKGIKPTKNEKFNEKHQELLEHIEKNGDVKFLFLTLSQRNENAEKNIENFNLRYAPKISAELIDINRLKRDYIEQTYKQILTNNPLEYQYNLEEEKVMLRIEHFYKGPGNFMKVEKPTKAYLFFLRPKQIYELFESYRYALFFKNVRNPLRKSAFNQQIIETARHEPDNFWYYNNGITAITLIMPEVGVGAKELEFRGLQVINGAQTIHSIHIAYNEATDGRREIMDRNMLITLRVLESVNTDFNMKVTRYTNSQNEIEQRDFHANDDVQIRLQEDSFKTKLWYEKRRGEFQSLPSNVYVVSNELVGRAYLSYHLQRPFEAANKRETIFYSHKEATDGLYEEVFNENTKFEDTYTSTLMFLTIGRLLGEMPLEFNAAKNLAGVWVFHWLALFKIVLTKYLEKKHGKEIDKNLFIKRAIEEKDEQKLGLLFNTFGYISYQVMQKFQLTELMTEGKDNEQIDWIDTQKKLYKIGKFLSSPTQYEVVKEYFEDIEIKVEDIENPEKIFPGLDEKRVKGTFNELLPTIQNFSFLASLQSGASN